MGLKAAVRSLQQIAEAARRELMLCSIALDDAGTPAPGLLELRRTVTAPLRYLRLRQARRHRARAKLHLDRLHDALHQRASLGFRNGELWGAILRGVDALALSRWLATRALTAADVVPARATVQLLLGQLTDLIGQIAELAWPGE